MVTPSPELEEIMQRVMKLSRQEKLMLAEMLHTVRPPEISDEALDPTPMMLDVMEEKGIIGTWADVDITDDAEWINDQKAKDEDKHAS